MLAIAVPLSVPIVLRSWRLMRERYYPTPRACHDHETRCSSRTSSAADRRTSVCQER